MGKVEDALRDLVRYHSKRAAAEALGKVPAQLRRMRHEMRGLQKAVGELSVQVRALLEARRREMAVPPASQEQATKARFSRRTLKSIRQRFDLTQQEMAKLLEVSPVTITVWETGKSRPRKANLAQIITLRTMDQAQVDGALGRESAPRAVKPEQLKRLRRRLSLTQAELAGLVGVSTAAVTSWETGKTAPSRQTRCVLVKLKGTPRTQVNERLGRRKGIRRGPAPRGGSQLSAKEIKAIRKAAGLSQRQMAARLRVSANAVSNWETGRSVPRGANVEKVMSLRK